MKKKKLTLGIAGALVAVSGLAACNEVTYNEGVILSYKDSSGTSVNFTAKELFDDYLPSNSSASTVFKNVREVLIRNYYNQPDQKSALDKATREAKLKVNGVRESAQKNADTNGTTYQVEWEKLLKSEGVENADELFDKKLLAEESDLFTKSYYTQSAYNAIRDGTRWTSNENGNTNLSTDELVKKYGPVTKGYLAEKAPYHVSHILVKLTSASNNEHTQDTISEKEAQKLSAVVKGIAGVNNDQAGVTPALNRLRFGTLASELSEDDGSAKNYGDLGIMDKSTGFVPEFKLGLYAFDALYNKQTKNAAADSYRATVAKSILPDAEDDRYDADEIKTSFKDRGIGTIPYGVFVALGKDEVAKNPNLGYPVNDNSATFYARNILFNKYMNSHQIAVITPNEIPFNQAVGTRDASWEKFDQAEGNPVYAVETDATTGLPNTKGVPSATYAALPGFQTDTTDVLDGIGSNVLTNEKGQIVIAVRAGTSGYQGIHFIVADRSALVEYASYDENIGAFKEIDKATYDAGKATKDVTAASEYYTMLDPARIPSNDTAASSEGAADKYYPYYKVGENDYAAKSTFVNKLQTTAPDYTANAEKVKDAVKSVVTDDSSYIFEELMVKGNVTFADSELGRSLEELITTYIKTSRNSATIDAMESFDKDWRTYMEYLDQEDAERQMNDKGNQELISEVCAIGYGSEDAKNGTGLWAKGGACYDGK